MSGRYVRYDLDVYTCEYREFFNDAPPRCYFSKLKKTLQLRYYYS